VEGCDEVQSPRRQEGEDKEAMDCLAATVTLRTLSAEALKLPDSFLFSSTVEARGQELSFATREACLASLSITATLTLT
jgi:hypothetical protein